VAIYIDGDSGDDNGDESGDESGDHEPNQPKPSSSFFNFDVEDYDACFEEVSPLFHEFGYAVPNVVLWSMSMAPTPTAYSSTSRGGALTVRAGCDAHDICAYLGIDNTRCIDRYNKKIKRISSCGDIEWQTKWNNLVKELYSTRYYELEEYFWNNKKNRTKYKTE
jgi:hypothetical protein